MHLAHVPASPHECLQKDNQVSYLRHVFIRVIYRGGYSYRLSVAAFKLVGKERYNHLTY